MVKLKTPWLVERSLCKGNEWKRSPKEQPLSQTHLQSAATINPGRGQGRAQHQPGKGRDWLENTPGTQLTLGDFRS